MRPLPLLALIDVMSVLDCTSREGGVEVGRCSVEISEGLNNGSGAIDGDESRTIDETVSIGVAWGECPAFSALLECGVEVGGIGFAVEPD